MAEKICGICNKKLDFRTEKAKCADGFVCKECLDTAKKDSSWPDFEMRYITFATIRKSYQVGKEIEVEEQAERAEQERIRQEELSIIEQFQPTDDYGQAKFDDESRTMILSASSHITYKPKHYSLFSYDQIIDAEVLESSDAVIRKAVTRTLVGGVVGGEIGAIVGAATSGGTSVCLSLKVKVTLKDHTAPCLYLTKIDSEIEKNSFAYRAARDNADRIVSKMKIILDSQAEFARRETETTAKSSIVEEILRLKELFDEGILTQEEFEAAKRKAVGL